MKLINKSEFGGNFHCYFCPNTQDTTLIDTDTCDPDGNCILICQKCVDSMGLTIKRIEKRSRKFVVTIFVNYIIESDFEDRAMLEAKDRFQKDVISRNILNKHLLEFDIHQV